MTHDEYLTYLESPWWRARKTAVILYRGDRCERCRSADHLELHHRTYERLGRELPEDVELLCERCHLKQHGLPLDSPRRNTFIDGLRLTDELAAVLASRPLDHAFASTTEELPY